MTFYSATIKPTTPCIYRQLVGFSVPLLQLTKVRVLTGVCSVPHGAPPGVARSPRRHLTVIIQAAITCGPSVKLFYPPTHRSFMHSESRSILILTASYKHDPIHNPAESAHLACRSSCTAAYLLKVHRPPTGTLSAGRCTPPPAPVVGEQLVPTLARWDLNRPGELCFRLRRNFRFPAAPYRRLVADCDMLGDQ